MFLFTLYFTLIIVISIFLRIYFLKSFNFSLDIFLMLIIFYSVELSFSFGITLVVFLGILSDYIYGTPLGFFVFNYVLIFYIIYVLKSYVTGSLFCISVLFLLSKIFINFTASLFYGVNDAIKINYNIFSLNSFLNLLIIPFVYNILSFIYRNLDKFKVKF